MVSSRRMFFMSLAGVCLQAGYTGAVHAQGIVPHAPFNDEDINTLQDIFAMAVPEAQRVDISEVEQATMLNTLKQYNEWRTIERPEFIVLVNRHPNVQHAAIALTNGDKLAFIGAAKVSTGDLNRAGHFATPLGIFENKREFGNYRAEGTRNSHGIRGYGVKGMRVFDFGWNPSIASWGARHTGDIRLQLHATDPDHLEPRLGKPASKGCVRVPSGFNRFMDEYGVLDQHYTPDNAWVLSKKKALSAYDGRYMIVMEIPPA